MLVTVADVRPMDAVVFGAVVFGAMVFVAAAFGEVGAGAGLLPVVLAAVALGPVVLTAALVAVAALALVPAGFDEVVAAGFAAVVRERAPADATDARAPVEAAGALDAARGELEDTTAELAANTPVRVGVGELLTRAASPALPLPTAALERSAMTKTTPISTAMAATTSKTRRSQ